MEVKPLSDFHKANDGFEQLHAYDMHFFELDILGCSARTKILLTQDQMHQNVPQYASL